jgi:hypothetical protein
MILLFKKYYSSVSFYKCSFIYTDNCLKIDGFDGILLLFIEPKKKELKDGIQGYSRWFTFCEACIVKQKVRTIFSRSYIIY